MQMLYSRIFYKIPIRNAWLTVMHIKHPVWEVINIFKFQLQFDFVRKRYEMDVRILGKEDRREL